MNIEPMVGLGRFRLGISLDDSLWMEIGEHVPFKRSYLQKNPSLRFPIDRVVVYFDNDNLSAGIEILSGFAFVGGKNLIGASLQEAKFIIGGSGDDFSYESGVLTSHRFKISLYIVGKADKRVVDSVIVFNDNYLNNNDSYE